MTSEHNTATAGFIRGKQKLILLGAAGVVVVGFFALASLADRSGPGDALYRFELTVVEPAAAAFRFSSTARAEYQFDRLVERMVETRDLSFTLEEGAEREALLEPVVNNIAHQVRSIFETLAGRNDERAVTLAIDTVAVLELYEATFYFEREELANTLGSAGDDARTALGALLQQYRDQYTLPELEEMLVREITTITDEAQNATPYTLGRVTENLYDILDTLGSGDVLGAYDIVFQIKIDLARDRFSQTLLG